MEGSHLRRVLDLRNLHVSQVGNLDWSPDGKRIVFDAYPGPWIVNRDGTGLKQITRSGTEPRWSPEGKRLLYIGGYGQHAILVFARDRWNTPIRTFPSASGMLYTASWSPDGAGIASVDERGTLHVLDYSTRRDIRRSFGSALCARRADHWCVGLDWKRR